MEKSIHIDAIGVFTFDKMLKTYTECSGKVHWELDTEDGKADMDKLIKAAENLSLTLDDFNRKAKKAIAAKLIDYKNDFWPEYDEDDENLDWDAVDAGVYHVTEEKFAETIVLYDITIMADEIYCEYYDGELFGGHRIHAHFDYDYELLKADI